MIYKLLIKVSHPVNTLNICGQLTRESVSDFPFADL